MHRTSAGLVAGIGWSRRRQAAAIRDGMSSGGRKDGSSGSMTGPPAGSSPAATRSDGRSSGLPSSSQAPERFLEQPQPHDVAQVADPAVDATLVGEVPQPARLAQDRPVELDPDQAPGAAGDVREVALDGRHADDGRRRVVRPDEDQLRRGRETGLGSNRIAQGADDVAGCAERRADPGRQPDGIDELVVPRPPAHVEQRRRRGVGDLADARARTARTRSGPG